MRSFLIINRCDGVRIRTSDGHVLRAFSGFYKHPAMINEDAWQLLHIDGQRVLVDSDTTYVMKDMICEWGFEACSDTVITCKITSTIEDADARTKDWTRLYRYVTDVRKAMGDHFDKGKVNELANTDLSSDIERLSIDSAENDPGLRKIPAATK